MKIKFNNSLSYQKEAVQAVVDVFKGCERIKDTFSNFSAEYYNNQSILQPEGTANFISIPPDTLLENIQKVQRHHKLDASTVDSFGHIPSPYISIEMETGTGKTYVFLKTILELYLKYKFTKFIIVVPSIAIKAGIYKSLEITEQHFKDEYKNIHYNYFIYDSKDLSKIREFTTSNVLTIMIVTKQALEVNEDRVLQTEHEKTEGKKPIEWLQQTKPIVIVDEPQLSLTEKGKKSVQALNPLITIGYSATHKEAVNLVYKLNAIDAYNQKLVKRIEVASLSISNDVSQGAYVNVLKIDTKKGSLEATVEIDFKDKDKIIRKKITLKKGDDLYSKSNYVDSYKQGYLVEDLYLKVGDTAGYIQFSSNDIEENKVIGSTLEPQKIRAFIQQTIKEHLDKEIRLNKYGIKVLSLFFIDAVKNYRYYKEETKQIELGEYAKIFEEEYLKLSNHRKYSGLSWYQNKVDVSNVHDGYFSIDKKNKSFIDTKTGNSESDTDTYNLIMKDKEKLLSFDSNLRFIFSHSALREGWDNPNVFQICTLKSSTGTNISRRQEIGRGLRLCVNQNGERVEATDVNILTVFTHENYEVFKQELEKEMESDIGIKFRTISENAFSHIVIDEKESASLVIEPILLGKEKSRTLHSFFKERGYIQNNNKIVEDKLKSDLDHNRIKDNLPLEFIPYYKDIHEILKNTVNADIVSKYNPDKKVTKLKVDKLKNEDFLKLWDAIKYKTQYEVQFDIEALIENCIQKINGIKVDKPKIYLKNQEIESIGTKGFVEGSNKHNVIDISSHITLIPDIITRLQNDTSLTRKSIATILKGVTNLHFLAVNPEQYIQACIYAIKNRMQVSIADGIVYKKIGDTVFYSQELFKSPSLVHALEELYHTEIEVDIFEEEQEEQNTKTLYEDEFYDSKVEEKFAQQLEQSGTIKFYLKLPSWFTIDTPLGEYNPDWAILIEREDAEQLFFVVETKGSTDESMLRPAEKSKIDYGKKHFEAISQGQTTKVGFEMASEFEYFVKTVIG